MRKGSHHSEETIIKIRLSNTGKHNNELSKRWIGDKVKYSGLHRWVRKELGRPSKCVNCETTTAKKFEWANVSGDYLRDTNDYVRLCTRCHRLIDDHTRKSWEKRRNNNKI